MTQKEKFDKVAEITKNIGITADQERNLVLAVIAESTAIIADELVKMNKNKESEKNECKAES